MMRAGMEEELGWATTTQPQVGDPASRADRLGRGAQSKGREAPAVSQSPDPGCFHPAPANSSAQPWTLCAFPQPLLMVPVSTQPGILGSWNGSPSQPSEKVTGKGVGTEST